MNDLIPQTLMVFAATDALFIETAFPADSMPRALIKYGKTFYRLTPEYWAWLYHKYQLVEDATACRECPEHVFVEILNRISALYNRAIELYGHEALKEAERTTDIEVFEKKLLAGSNAASSVTPSSVLITENEQPKKTPALEQTLLPF